MKMQILIPLVLLFAATFVPRESFGAGEKILMVVTSADQMGEDQPTGLWLEEFAVPYLMFRDAGFEVTVASTKGGKAPVDPRSLENGAQVYGWAEAIVELNDTKPLSAVDASGFDAVFLPGGHGTMFDFPGDANLSSLLTGFAADDKVIAAVCHGPAALVGATKPDGTPLVAGRTVTAFTDEEEVAVDLDEEVPFMLEARLREQGAKFVPGEKWASHVQVDGKLVTGQNPASSEAAAEAVIRILK